jgi:hypothetical protein
MATDDTKHSFPGGPSPARTPTPSEPQTEAAVNAFPAVSHGGALGDRDLPPSLADTLRRCVQRHGDKHLIHISPDGTESRQTYTALWDEATRMARGLRQCGMPAAGMIVLQFDASRDFLAAFWGAVLGGFVPVPVGVPATIDPSSPAVRRFCSAWQFLERPLVLTCERLAPAVRSMLGGGL